MKLAVFSDLHVTNHNSKFRTNEYGVSDLLSAQYDFVDLMCREVEADDEIAGILFLGDISDDATLDPITSTYLNRIIRRVVTTGRHLLFIEGNHSIDDGEARFTVLGAVRELLAEAREDQQICLVTQADLVQMGGINFWVHPYKADYRKVEEEIAESNRKAGEAGGCNILLFHFPCTNAQLDNGLMATRGVHLTEDLISNFDLALGGDYHNPQQLVGTSKAYYVGAPFDLKYNEQTNEPRGWIVVDVDETGHLMKRFRNPFNYRMVAVESQEFLGLDFDNPERTILKVTGPLNPGEKEAALGMGFYRFTHLKGKRGLVEQPDIYMVPDESHLSDLKLVDEQLDTSWADVSPSIKRKMYKLFVELESGDR